MKGAGLRIVCVCGVTSTCVMFMKKMSFAAAALGIAA